MTSPRDSSAFPYAGPPQLPLPPGPGFVFQPAGPIASGPRVACGILLALASGFVGFGWLALTGLMLAFESYGSRAGISVWVGLGLVGLIITLSGIGGIGTAVTARRPIHDRWVRCWVWTSCVFGGLGAAIVVAFLVYLRASGT